MIIKKGDQQRETKEKGRTEMGYRKDTEHSTSQGVKWYRVYQKHGLDILDNPQDKERRMDRKSIKGLFLKGSTEGIGKVLGLVVFSYYYYWEADRDIDCRAWEARTTMMMMV